MARGRSLPRWRWRQFRLHTVLIDRVTAVSTRSNHNTGFSPGLISKMYRHLLAITVAVLASNSAYADFPGYLKEPSALEGPVTVERLKSKFGARLKESNFICTLSPNAVLRQPLEWDCKTWSAEKVLFGDFIPMDAVSYRARPDGKIVSSAYGVKTDCATALSYMLTVGDTDRYKKRYSAVGLEFNKDSQVRQGFMKTDSETKFGTSHIELELNDGRCELSISYESK